jgi:micrococcal nuclease
VSGVRVPIIAMALLVGLGYGVAAADGTLSGVGMEETARVVGVIDGDTLLIEPSAGERREVRLMGVQAPKPFPDGSEAWLVPHADAARQGLARLAAGRTVVLIVPEQRTNRYGQLLAHVHRNDGVWLQGEMLRQGLVRVQTLPSTCAHAEEMLAIEAEARRAGRGLWADPRFAVRSPEAAAHDVGSFQIVEGTVRKATRRQNRVYLNFGDDWRSDFTVSVPARLAAALAGDGLDLMALGGRRIRVRGWIDSYNGPMIELTHREQLELLGHVASAAPLTAIPPAAAAAPAGAPGAP